MALRIDEFFKPEQDGAMGSLKDNLNYTPPDFSIFEKWAAEFPVARGAYLYIAYKAIDQMEDGYWEGAAKEGQTFLDWPNQHTAFLEKDLLDVYAGWAKADDMLRRLEGMPAEERRKHLEFDKKHHDLDFDEVMKEFAEYTGKIAALELERGEEYEQVLDGLLKRRIRNWEKYLDYQIQELEAPESEKDPAFGVEPMESLGDLCDERTTLEYAVDGIGALQIAGYDTVGRSRLRNLPFLPEFKKKLETLDKKFRKALGDHRQVEPWADPVFWWLRPVKSNK